MVGEQVQVVSVVRGDGWRELVTTCERAGRQYEVAVLDVDLTDADATLLVAAYRRWHVSRRPAKRTDTRS